MSLEMIPYEILSIELKEIDGEYKTLRQLIKETTNETVTACSYHVDTVDEENVLVSFMANTENLVLELKHTPLGSFFVTYERNRN